MHQLAIALVLELLEDGAVDSFRVFLGVALSFVCVGRGLVVWARRRRRNGLCMRPSPVWKSTRRLATRRCPFLVQLRLKQIETESTNVIVGDGHGSSWLVER